MPLRVQGPPAAVSRWRLSVECTLRLKRRWILTEGRQVAKQAVDLDLKHVQTRRRTQKRKKKDEQSSRKQVQRAKPKQHDPAQSTSIEMV